MNGRKEASQIITENSGLTDDDRQMERDPFIHWLLMMVTFGQYGLLWGFRLFRDTNALLGGGAFDTIKHARALVVGYSFYVVAAIGLTFATWNQFDHSPLVDVIFWCVYIYAVGLAGYFLWILVRVAQMLRRISGREVPRSGVVVLLFFLWMICLPVLQNHLNRHLKKKPNQVPEPMSGQAPGLASS